MAVTCSPWQTRAVPELSLPLHTSHPLQYCRPLCNRHTLAASNSIQSDSSRSAPAHLHRLLGSHSVRTADHLQCWSGGRSAGSQENQGQQRSSSGSHAVVALRSAHSRLSSQQACAVIRACSSSAPLKMGSIRKTWLAKLQGKKNDVNRAQSAVQLWLHAAAATAGKAVGRGTSTGHSRLRRFDCKLQQLAQLAQLREKPCEQSAGFGIPQQPSAQGTGAISADLRSSPTWPERSMSSTPTCGEWRNLRRAMAVSGVSGRVQGSLTQASAAMNKSAAANPQLSAP